MTITTIAQALTWPNNAVVEAIEGTIVGVYERKTIHTKYGEKPKQSATLKDVAGNSMRIEAWEHPDLTPLKGKNVILFSSAGRGGSGALAGVKVKHDSYEKDGQTVHSVGLDVSRSGQFQLSEVYRASGKAPETPVPANPSQSVVKDVATHVLNDKTPINPIKGEKVGMLINNAVLLHTSAGLPCGMEALWSTVVDLKRLSDLLEQGAKEYTKEAVPAKVKNENEPF